LPVGEDFRLSDPPSFLTMSQQEGSKIASEPGKPLHADVALRGPTTRSLAEVAYLSKLGARLTRFNYGAWEMRIRAALRGENLERFVLGTYPLDPQWTAEEQAVWRKLDAFLIGVLLGNISDEFVAIVGEEDTSAKTWIAIRNQFGIAGSIGLVNIFTQLTRTKFCEVDDIHEHVNFFHSLRLEAARIKRPLADEIFAILLRISMPNSWDHVFSNLPEVVTTSDIESRITAYANTLQTRSAIESEPTRPFPVSYVARTGKNMRGKEDRDARGEELRVRVAKDPPPCKHCGKTGHVSDDCYERGGGASRQPLSQRNGPSQEVPTTKNTTADHYPETTHYAVSYGAFDLDLKPSKWIADSGSTFHICRERDAFITLDDSPASRSTIAGIASGVPSLKVLGRGDVLVRSRLAHGKIKTIRLRDVAYVPDARTNVLSLGRGDARGYQHLTAEGRLRILRPSPRGGEIMFGRFRKGLYVLNVETIRQQRPAGKNPDDVSYLAGSTIRTSNATTNIAVSTTSTTARTEGVEKSVEGTDASIFGARDVRMPSDEFVTSSPGPPSVASSRSRRSRSTRRRGAQIAQTAAPVTEATGTHRCGAQIASASIVHSDAANASSTACSTQDLARHSAVAYRRPRSSSYHRSQSSISTDSDLSSHAQHLVHPRGPAFGGITTGDADDASSTFPFHSDVLRTSPAAPNRATSSRPLWRVHNCHPEDAQQIAPATFDCANHDAPARCCAAQITAPRPTTGLASDIDNASLGPDAHPSPHPSDMLDGEYFRSRSATSYTTTMPQESDDLFAPESNVSSPLIRVQLPRSDSRRSAVENHPSPTSISKPSQVFSAPPTAQFTIGCFMLAILSISPLVSGF
jgi:hypothetical protein